MTSSRAQYAGNEPACALNKGEELAKEVDKQDWDPSIKAMAQFPSVLENMDKNLSWTSSLGDAYMSRDYHPRFRSKYVLVGRRLGGRAHF
jgi:hypothetical protein